MGRTHRLLAATILICVASAACDASVRTSGTPPGPSTTPPATAGPATGAPRTPVPTTDLLLPDANAARYVLRDVRAPARLAGATHDLTFVIEERHSTIAAGLVREVWTLGGIVPGPVIRLRVGDALRILVDNHPPILPGRAAWGHPASNQHAHSVDFSAAAGPDGAMAPIRPGAKEVLEFTAVRAGVWLYHCSADPTFEHLANGEYGMLIVEPEGGLDPVDEELFLVQGEWYVGKPFDAAPMDKVASGVPDFVVFNGVAKQYVDHPIEVATGTRIRIFLLDAGPSLDLPFRLEGAALDRVIRDGVALEPGTTGVPAGVAIDLSRGQGAIVEFTFAEDGLYAFTGHALDDAARGATGLFRAGAGDPNG